MPTRKYPLRVLLVEDDPVDREAVTRFVEQQRLPYDLCSVATAGEALRCLAEMPFDVALLDYDLGADTAFEILGRLGDTPSIIVTARGDEEVASEALRRGAYDYLAKDHDRAYLGSLPSTITNVVERKRAERALRESEARYQDLFDHAPDMYFELKEDGTVAAVNRQGAVQLGYTAEELLGQPVATVVHPDDLARVESQIRDIRAQPSELHHIEFRKVRKDGSVLHVSENLSVQTNDDGESVMRILCRDITAQKEAEARAQQLQERLARSERMESLGILAGGVAHDLNNILGPLVAYPDLLLDSFPEGSDKHGVVLEMKRSAARAAAVIRDLLTLARRGRYALEPMDLDEAIASYVQGAGFAELESLYPQVTTDIQVDAGLPPVMGSPVNLNKVLMNLVINAFEAMPEGGALRLSASLASAAQTFHGYERMPPGDYVKLVVHDTGSGISRDDLGHIFEPFFTRKTMGRSGSGLGLSVVYGVVKDHAGYIDVQSGPGEGTAIQIYLPVAHKTESVPVAETDEAVTGQGRVLVVDDIREQRLLARTLLADLGYDVETAANGHEALGLLREAREEGATESPFDVVLLDMIMEENFDGLETYRDMVELFPGQRCVIVSGYSETVRVKEAQALGAGGYLAKPYTQEELGRALEGVLKGRGEGDRV